ncbi:MAG: TolC family protein [Brumimicrobium sp.]|nr:TolC family protein [Brumimicrobium sp.]
MKSIILILSILIISLQYTGAQETLSASEAVLIALENNFDMEIAGKRTEIAEKKNNWSEAGLFPTVDLTAGYNQAIVDNTNNPFTFTPGLIYNAQASPSLNINWNLFSCFRVKITKDQLQQLEEQSKGNAAVILENTAFDVLNAYYNVVLQQKQLDNLNEVFELTKKRVEYEESKQRLGQSNQLAVAQNRNQLLTDSINIMQQEINRDNAYRNLLLLMNVPAENMKPELFPVLTDSLNINLSDMDDKEVQKKIASNNQNLKNQLINLELQKTNTSLQRTFLYPTLSLQLGGSPSFGNFRALNDQNLNASTQQITYFANVNLRYTLFNNWKTKRAVEISRIEEEIAQLNISELEKQLYANSINLIELFTLRNRLVNVAAANREYALLAYQAGQDRYNLGALNSIDLMQLQLAYLNAQLNYSTILFQRIQTYLEIYRVTGMLQLEYKK